MPNYVAGVGNSSAKLLILGEAPGAAEDDLQLPFVGPTGNLLDEILLSAGISRKDCYLTNVVKYRPPDNDITRFVSLGKGTIQEQLPELYNEISQINPNCILALGEIALHALTGNKKIQNYRGSILNCPKTGHKVVPTIHPTALLSHGDTQLPWKNLAFIKQDAKRAVEQSEFPEIRRPYRNLLIARSSLDVIRFFERNIQSNQKTKVTVDVETYKTYSQCFGIAFNNYEAMSIPTFDKRIEIHELAQIWKLLYDFFRNDNNLLIAQNSKFDEKRSRQLGLTWHNLYFDIPMAWHCLYSEFPKKLAFLTSLLTEEPYYKDEGAEVDPKNIDNWFYYNCKDAVCEFEVYEKVHQMLREENLEDFYFDKIHPLHRLYSDLEDTGILIDKVVNDNLYKKYTSLLSSKREILLNKIQSIHPEAPTFSYKIRSKKQDKIKDVKIIDMNPASHQQVAAVIYGYLGCPIRKDTGSNTLKALANNAVKNTEIKSILQGFIEDRKIAKTIGTYINAKPSSDGRIRTQVNINGTDGGRTSNNNLEPPVSIHKEGLALQTMTKHEDTTTEAGGADLRSQFIADKHFYFVEADLSGAEDHVVCTLAEDWEGLKELNRKTFIYNKHGLKDDRHTKTAIMTCERSFEDITDYYRQVGKKNRHAGNYLMGKGEMMQQLAGVGIFISEWKCGKMLEAFHNANPKIKSVFHTSVIDCLRKNDRTLVSPLGRREKFFDRWEDIPKKAFSFIPQSTVSDSVKFAMVRIKSRIDSIARELIYFVQESHDSFLALVHESIVTIATRIIKQEMSRPIDFNLCSIKRDHILIIPSEIKIGKRWIDKSDDFPDGMSKYKEGMVLPDAD